MIPESKLRYERIKGVPHIREPGNSVRRKTGSWRVFKPVWDFEKCILCKQCWLFCPEAAINWKKRPEVDYDVCKGCGVCAQVCPVQAIKMVRDTHEKD